MLQKESLWAHLAPKEKKRKETQFTVLIELEFEVLVRRRKFHRLRVTRIIVCAFDRAPKVDQPEADVLPAALCRGHGKRAVLHEDVPLVDGAVQVPSCVETSEEGETFLSKDTG